MFLNILTEVIKHWLSINNYCSLLEALLKSYLKHKYLKLFLCVIKMLDETRCGDSCLWLQH